MDNRNSMNDAIGFTIKFDPSNSNTVMYEMDKLVFEMISKTKFITVKRVIEILDSVEQAKRAMMAKIEDVTTSFDSSVE